MNAASITALIATPKFNYEFGNLDLIATQQPDLGLWSDNKLRQPNAISSEGLNLGIIGQRGTLRAAILLLQQDKTIFANTRPSENFHVYFSTSSAHQNLNPPQSFLRSVFPQSDLFSKVVINQPCPTQPYETWFNLRSDRWEKDTAIYSAPGETYLHKDYMAIITKGIENPEHIIPLILKRLTQQGGDWFFALEKITDENPALACEDYDCAVAAWTDWAKQRGMIKASDVVSPS